MRLPNAKKAVVERGKIVDYLLNPAHPDNGGKAAFFAALGFSRDDWRKLAAALRELTTTADVIKSVESAHGRKYVLRGQIHSPSGKTPAVLAVWIVDRGMDAPRLVTAYPHEN